MSEENKNLKVTIENRLNSKWLKPIMAGIIILLIITNWTSCENRKEEKRAYEQNKKSFQKELVTEMNKNGDLQTSVEVYKGKVKDLDEYSKDLAEEVENLKRRKPKVIAKTKIVYRDTNITITDNSIDTIGLNTDEYRLSWKYENQDSTRLLEGNSVFNAEIKNKSLEITPKFTKITKDELSLDFVVGIAKNKKTGYDEIFVTPKNKNVSVKNLEGAILEKSKLGINLSLYLGYGVYYGNQQFGLAPSFGISISKPLIRF